MCRQSQHQGATEKYSGRRVTKRLDDIGHVLVIAVYGCFGERNIVLVNKQYRRTAIVFGQDGRKLADEFGGIFSVVEILA